MHTPVIRHFSLARLEIKTIRSFGLGLILLMITFNCATAQEVTLHHQGLTLNAKLSLAKDKTFSDGMILITHGGLAHNGMELITYLQTLLKEKHYNSLAINLSLGINNRHNMYDCKTTHRHQQTDALDEIDAWIQWLASQGTQKVVILGHSRGGLQTALYASEKNNVLLSAVVLLAPATRDNGAAGYVKRFGGTLAPLLKQAQQLINDGKGDTLLQHANLLFCSDTTVTANTFVSYYGSDPRLDTPYLIPKINKPLLVLVAGNDQVVVGLDKKIAPLKKGRRFEMAVIDSSGHFFRDLFADDAVDIMDSFLVLLEY